MQYPSFVPDTQFFAPSSSEVAEMVFYSILLKCCFILFYFLSFCIFWYRTAPVHAQVYF